MQNDSDSKAQINHWNQCLESIAKTRDKQQYMLFYDHFAPRLKSWLLGVTKDDTLAEEIEKETAEINLQKATIEAETQRTLADAQAYEKRVILEADNALADKLQAEIEIQKLWAEAFAKRSVPTNVFGSGDGGAPVGSDGETKAFMQMLTLDAAKRLSYDREISPTP